MKKYIAALLLSFIITLSPAQAQFGACLPAFCNSPPPSSCGGNNVVLLMPFSGTNGSTGSPGMDDISPAAHGAANVNSGAQISTAQFRFGPSSLLIAPTSDFIFYPSSSDWGISAANSSQFTIEFQIDYSSIANNRVAIGLTHVADGTFGFVIQNNGASELQFAWSPTGLFADIQTLTTSGAGLTTGAFIPIAVTKDNTGTLRIFINGLIKASSTPANSVIHNTGVTGISIGGTTSASNSQDAWIDEVRIVKDAACYVANYTPSTIPFPP